MKKMKLTDTLMATFLAIIMLTAINGCDQVTSSQSQEETASEAVTTENAEAASADSEADTQDSEMTDDESEQQVGENSESSEKEG